MAADASRRRRETLAENSTAAAGGFSARARRAVERGADLVWLMDDDGLPEPDCLTLLLEREDLDFWGPAVLAAQDPDRLCFPIRLPGRHHGRARDGRGRAGRADGLINGVRDPVQRRPGHPRAGRADRPARAPSSSSGATTWSTSGAPRRPVPGSPRSWTAHVLHPATDDLGTPMMFGRTTYNHSPSDLKHYCMARNNTRQPARLPRLAARADVLGQDRLVLPVHQARPGRLATERAGGVRRAARRLHRPPEVPRRREHETVAVVVVTYNRASLLTRMLVGLAALDHAPGRGDRGRQRQHRPHRDVLDTAGDRTECAELQVIRPEENLGGAGGFHLGVQAAYEQGYDRIWLLDDDVVPAPDCLSVLLGRQTRPTA